MTERPDAGSLLGLADLALDVDQNCGEVRCEAGWEWNVRLPDFDVWMVVAGQGIATVSGCEYQLRAGTTLLLRPELAVHARQNPGRRLRVVYAHFRITDRGAQLGRPADALPPVCTQLPPGSPSLGLMREIVALAGHDGPLVPVARAARLLVVLVDLLQTTRDCLAGRAGADPRILAVMSAIRSEPGYRRPLAQAAELVDLGPQRFSRLFRQTAGTSYRDFCLSARLDRARHLLTETPMTVTAIADALGYTDVCLLSRQMRARFGESPRELRHASAVEHMRIPETYWRSPAGKRTSNPSALLSRGP